MRNMDPHSTEAPAKNEDVVDDRSRLPMRLCEAPAFGIIQCAKRTTSGATRSVAGDEVVDGRLSPVPDGHPQLIQNAVREAHEEGLRRDVAEDGPDVEDEKA